MSFTNSAATTARKARQQKRRRNPFQIAPLNCFRFLIKRKSFGGRPGLPHLSEKKSPVKPAARGWDEIYHLKTLMYSMIYFSADIRACQRFFSRNVAFLSCDWISHAL